MPTAAGPVSDAPARAGREREHPAARRRDVRHPEHAGTRVTPETQHKQTQTARGRTPTRRLLAAQHAADIEQTHGEMENTRTCPASQIARVATLVPCRVMAVQHRRNSLLPPTGKAELFSIKASFFSSSSHPPLFYFNLFRIARETKEKGQPGRDVHLSSLRTKKKVRFDLQVARWGRPCNRSQKHPWQRGFAQYSSPP